MAKAKPPKVTNSDRLNPRQMRAVECLLTATDVKAAARSAGIGYQTLRRWMIMPDFVASLNAAKADATRHATGRLAGALSTSITTVIHLAESSDDEPTRLRAALAVVAMLREPSDFGDFAERLSQVEERLGYNQRTTEQG